MPWRGWPGWCRRRCCHRWRRRGASSSGSPTGARFNWKNLGMKPHFFCLRLSTLGKSSKIGFITHVILQNQNGIWNCVSSGFEVKSFWVESGPCLGLKPEAPSSWVKKNLSPDLRASNCLAMMWPKVRPTLPSGCRQRCSFKLWFPYLVYRETIHLGANLPLTLIWKLRFTIWSLY